MQLAGPVDSVEKSEAFEVVEEQPDNADDEVNREGAKFEKGSIQPSGFPVSSSPPLTSQRASDVCGLFPRTPYCFPQARVCPPYFTGAGLSVPRGCEYL